MRLISLLLSAAFTLAVPLDEGHAAHPMRRDDNLPARIPYIFPAPGTDPIADKIRARRNGTLLALDGVLLNAPLVARAWNNFFGVIRDNSTLPADMRELVILRIAVLNNAAYEWTQHEKVGRAAGLTTQQLLAIRLKPFRSEGGSDPSSILRLGPALNAAMVFTDHITKNVQVPDGVFNDLARFLNDAQMLEVVTTAGAYNLVSRVLESLNVDGKMDVAVPIPK